MQVTPPYGSKWRRTKEPLDEGEREDEKVGLKLNIQKAKNRIQSHPLWETEREKVETVTDFIFLGSKTTADSDCSLEIKKNVCSLAKETQM